MLVSKEEREKIRHQIDDLEFYLIDKQNITVVFGYDEENCLVDNAFITINTRQNLRYQLHSLLHEAGHVMLRKNKNHFQKKFPGISRKSNSISYRLDRLKEEITAWERGKSIAKRLDIDIDEKWWNRHSNKCIHDYVKWAADVRR